jgi:hypothetical protein
LLARRDRPALVAVIAVQVVLALAAGLAFDHVQDAARHFARGAGIVGCSLGAGLLGRAERLLARDRSLMDSWGIAPLHEWVARALVAMLGALPVMAVTSSSLPLGWTLEATPVLAWAIVHALRPTHADRPVIARFFVRTIAAIVIVVGFDSTLPLLAWTLIELLGLPRAHAHAEALRRRVASDLPQRDEHGL